MCKKTIFFDLDDTLYLPTSGIWEAIGKRIEHYMVEKLDFSVEQAPTERHRLFCTHGTTLRGLVIEYQIDDLDFLEYVHDIPIEEYLSENIELRETIARYPQRKVIFTNANTGHAERVLNSLGIADLFEQLIDIRAIKPWCKPQPEAFVKALELASVDDPKNCIMIDDAYRNLVTAHELGLFTVQVGAKTALDPIDAAISKLEDLPAVLPY